jgi:hypothetical protein
MTLCHLCAVMVTLNLIALVVLAFKVMRGKS